MSVFKKKGPKVTPHDQLRLDARGNVEKMKEMASKQKYTKGVYSVYPVNKEQMQARDRAQEERQKRRAQGGDLWEPTRDYVSVITGLPASEFVHLDYDPGVFLGQGGTVFRVDQVDGPNTGFEYFYHKSDMDIAESGKQQAESELVVREHLKHAKRSGKPYGLYPFKKKRVTDFTINREEGGRSVVNQDES